MWFTETPSTNLKCIKSSCDWLLSGVLGSALHKAQFSPIVVCLCVFLSDVSGGRRSNGPAAATATDSHSAVGAVGVGRDSQPHHPDCLCAAHASPAQLHQPPPASTHGHHRAQGLHAHDRYSSISHGNIQLYSSICFRSVNQCALKNKEMKEREQRCPN